MECTRPKRTEGSSSAGGKGSGKTLKHLDAASEVGTSAGVSSVGLTEEQLQTMIKRAVEEREKSTSSSETGSASEDFSSMVKGLVHAGNKQKTIKVSAILANKALRGLLDSGATNVVRNWRPSDSLETRREIRVELAVGDHRNLEISDVGSIVMSEGTVIQPIIPLLMMTKVLNCVLTTESNGRLRLTHPTHGRITIDETDGTPQIDADLTADLIEEIESKVRNERTRQVRETLVKKAMAFACGWSTGKMPDVNNMKGTEESVREFSEFLKDLQVHKFDAKVDEWGKGDQRGCPERKHVLMSMKLAKFGLTATEADVMRLGKHIDTDDILDSTSTEAVSGDRSTEGVCIH